ncbi:MAG: heme exporter protein CcmD [Methylovirgula sp.]
MTADPNVGFVVAAYLVALAVIAGMIVATIADYAGLKKRLERLAARTDRGLDPRRK